MKRWIQGLGIGILVAAVALAALWLTAGVAWAHGPEGTPGRPERPAWAGGNGTLLDVAAEVLGLDRTELIAQLQDGKTLAQIAWGSTPSWPSGGPGWRRRWRRGG